MMMVNKRRRDSRGRYMKNNNGYNNNYNNGYNNGYNNCGYYNEQYEMPMRDFDMPSTTRSGDQYRVSPQTTYPYMQNRRRYSNHMQNPEEELCLTKQEAKEWVNGMQGKDGQRGGHWDYQKAIELGRQHGISFDKFTEDTFYAVLNAMYADYYNPRFDVSMYIQLAKDFLLDPDSKWMPDEKAYVYYMNFVEVEDD